MNLLISTSLLLIFSISIGAFTEDLRHLSKRRNLVKDLEDEEKDEMSKFALNTLNSLDATNSKRILCQVLDGRKQFASGIVYKLKLSLLVVADNSFESKAKNSSSLCDKNGERVVCEVDLLRSYAATDYSPVSVQVVKSECTDDNGESIRKREVSERITGDFGETDTNSEYIKSIAARLVTKSNADSRSKCKRKAYRILQASSAAPLTVEQLQFHHFMQKFNKQYENEEEKERRYRIFCGNLKKIQMLNEGEEGTAEYRINEFADLSKSEFIRYYLGLKPNGDTIKKQATIPNVSIPPELDWRTYNAVTPVKNQGMCGSCWAFSVTGNVEGQYALKHKQLISLSEQELVDCDKKDDGCNGGYMSTAYQAIENIGGLEQEKDYPYKGSKDKCVFNKTTVAAKVVDYLNITRNETDMAHWLFKNGPISVAINAFAMQFYFRGISKPWKFLCNPNKLNHGVLIVGYGQDKKMPFWIIKNSWGSHWGESGYYRLYRGSGACGVNEMPSSAVID